MRDKINNLLFRIWLYILNRIHTAVDRKIELDKNNLYVVYYSNLIDDIYICEDGKSGLELVKLCTELNHRLNRKFTHVLYGKVDSVFKYKMVKISNLCFTFDATDEQRRDVCKFIADVPLIK